MNNPADVMKHKYRQVFESPTGREVLADLRAEFYDRDLTAPTAHDTTVAAAQHSVVRYILEQMEDVS